MSRKNLKKEILQKMKEFDEDEDDIISIKASNKKGYGDTFTDKPPLSPESLDFFDYEASMGFGGGNCHAFYIYTDKNIYFKSMYDGSEGVEMLPRNPTDEYNVIAFGGG